MAIPCLTFDLALSFEHTRRYLIQFFSLFSSDILRVVLAMYAMPSHAHEKP